MAIWKWAKANGIDQGLPFEKVHEAINEHFFAGAAKPEWITDILSGRKTPFRSVANEAWRTQYNRRMIVEHAQNLTQQQAMSPAGKAFHALWSAPRTAAVFGHGWVFPITHAGDLLLRPASWGTFFRGLINTYAKSFSKEGTERLLDSMRRSARYDLALRSGLDVGARSHAGNLVNRAAKGSQSTRAWDILTTMRFELWDRAMDKHIDPKMSQEEQLDIGKNLAEWSNHATGSGKGAIATLSSKLPVLFGPKLTQSKLNRIFADPVKTVQTFANWNNATAGERIVARTRLSGMVQYGVTGLGFLVANQGLLQALNSNQKINFTDPSKSDWLRFKGLGLDVGLPGLHSELKTIAQILAIPFMPTKDVRTASYGKAKSKTEYFEKLVSDYAFSKATPTIGLAKELFTGEAFPARPVPWSAEKGTKSQPKMSWPEYLSSHAPILATNPARYFFDQLRKGGMSAFDSAAIMKGLILSVVGATGMHVTAEKEAAKRAQVGRQLMRR